MPWVQWCTVRLASLQLHLAALHVECAVLIERLGAMALLAKGLQIALLERCPASLNSNNVVNLIRYSSAPLT